MNTKTFDPARMPPRCEEGYSYHPDIDAMMPDGWCEDDEGAIDTAKVTAAGFDARYVGMDSQLDDNHPAVTSYLDGGGCEAWEPEAPSVDRAWQLIAIYDTEDGPYAMFVSPTDAARGAQPGGGEHG